MMKKIKQNFKDIDWDLLGGPYSITSMVLKYGTEREKKDYVRKKGLEWERKSKELRQLIYKIQKQIKKEKEEYKFMRNFN